MMYSSFPEEIQKENYSDLTGYAIHLVFLYTNEVDFDFGCG